MSEQVRPGILTAEWTNWVLSQLRDTEKDQEGNPKVEGLRRLTEELLGEIIYSCPDSIIGADQYNLYRSTVIYRIKLRWNNDANDVREYGAAADIYPGNSDDVYARHAAATADTRAEARALRKALKLVNTLAAEEKTTVPVSESGLSGSINSTQIKMIRQTCKTLNINVQKFYNSGSKTYRDIAHIPYVAACNMTAKLNRYQQKSDEIPDSIKGYKESEI